MKVEQLTSLTPVNQNKQVNKPATHDGSFAKLVDLKKIKQQSGEFNLSQVNSALVLQQVNAINDNLEHRRKRLDYAKELLNKLQLIKVLLLQNKISLENLEQLSTYLEQLNELSTDPELEQLINEIEVLTAATLAKLKKLI